MADLNYQVGIDTRQASRNLDALKSQIVGFGSAIAGAFAFREISNVSSRFEDLRTTLQLLYKDSQLGSAAFEDIKKFAANSIFSVEDLTETIVKLKAAGLEPTVAMLRLFADTSSVAADSVGALQAITDLYARTTAGGLGLEDLNRLADRGIPVFSILSERLGVSRLEISKLGQTAEGARIILKALEDGLQDAFGGASEARANNVSQAVSNLGDAFSNASDVIGRAGLNEGLTKLIRSFSELITAITPLLDLLGRALGAVLTHLAENLKIIISLAGGFIAAFAIGRIAAIITAVIGLTKAFNLLNVVVGKNPIVGILQRLAIIGGATLGLLSSSALDLSGEIAKLTGETDKLANGDGFKVLQEGNLGAGTENLRESLAKVNAELNKFRVEMDSVVASFARFNRENIQAINLETELIGKSTELRRIREAEAEITNRTAEEIARLTEQKAKLTEEEKKQGRGAVIDETIKKIQQQAEADKAATTEAIRNSEARIAARRLEEFQIQTQIDVNKDLRRVQDDIAKSTMTEIQKKQYDILSAARERAKAEIRAEEIRRGSVLTDAEKLKYYEAAKKGTEDLIKAEQTAYEQSRLFSTGWKQALNDYVDNATNAANRAKNIFQKATQGMEDMIVNFAKTGKFEFKSFVNSILEELLRSQIRQTMAQIFQIPGLGGGSSTGGSMFGSIGKLLGFANGGIIPTNSPVVVGERGPELLMGASGRQVIPNEQLGTSTNVTYNINAVDASSFKALVAADPSFIHAVAMQGAKTVPGRR